MKKVFAIILAIIAMFSFSACGTRRIKEITSVEAIRLTSSSYFGGNDEYELVVQDKVAELRYYADDYTDDRRVHILKDSAVCDAQRIIELMNTCRVARWNGFSKDDSGVLDGTSFTFTANVNDGEIIKADGYSKFPEGYGDFVAGLEDILEEYGTAAVEETTVCESLEPISEFEWIVLTISDDGNEILYDINACDGKAEVYCNKVTDTSENLYQSAVCDTEEIIELINTCNVQKWDGFFEEKEDDYEGTRFRINACIGNATENRWIYVGAEGCDEFPDGYDEFVKGLEKILEENVTTEPSCETAEPITSVEYIRISESSYHSGSVKYEAINYYGEMELCRYRASGGQEYELEKSVVCNTEDVIDLMNTYNVSCWDGFDRDNHLVLDGTSFSFTATVDDGKEIYARGYAKTPNGYGKFVAELERLLEEG